jgi:hypothetical protein
MIKVREDNGIPYPVRECVGCGYCCIKTPCDAARRLYPGARSCPQLLWIEQESRYKCGLMMIAGPVGQGYKSELYAGAGCCSGLNSWRKDVKKRDHLDMDMMWNPLDPIFQIFIRRLSANFVSSDTISLTIASMDKELKEKGYSDRETNHIKTMILHQFCQNRSKFTEEFIG